MSGLIRSLSGSAVGRQFRQGIGESFGLEYTKGKNMGFLGKNMPGGMMGAGKLAFGMRLIGPAFIGVSAYSGYKEGGAFGAAKSVAKDAAIWGGIRAAGALAKGAMLNPVVLGGAAVAGLGYAGYKFGEHAQRHSRSLRNVEMGGDVVDKFGTMASIRQRSLSALNNSHVNGRMALGNEAILMASPYLR